MLICVTGIKGSGKTTAMDMIANMGYSVFIMDEYIHNIYKTDEIGYLLIKKHFGINYLNKYGVDREKLGKLVFSDSKQLEKLNKIMIPVMQYKIADLKAQNKLIFVELAIYLFHIDKFKKYFKKVLCILGRKKISKNIFLENFFNTKNFPTNSVGKYKNITLSKRFNSWYFVENNKNKKDLQKNIKNFLTFLKK